VQDSLLEHMTGTWILRGSIAGKETTHDIIAEWVLDHEYIQIKEVSREKKADGKPEYEAIVYITFDQKLDQYSCLWLDNTGNGGLAAQAIGHAKRNGDKMEFLFIDNDNSVFHTTFLYEKTTGTWQWLMDSEEKGKLQSFAKMKITKK
jgi:hypothetical protein